MTTNISPDCMREAERLTEFVLDRHNSVKSPPREDAVRELARALQQKDDKIARLKEHLKVEEDDNERNCAAKYQLRSLAIELRDALQRLLEHTGCRIDESYFPSFRNSLTKANTILADKP